MVPRMFVVTMVIVRVFVIEHLTAVVRIVRMFMIVHLTAVLVIVGMFVWGGTVFRFHRD